MQDLRRTLRLPSRFRKEPLQLFREMRIMVNIVFVPSEAQAVIDRRNDAIEALGSQSQLLKQLAATGQRIVDNVDPILTPSEQLKSHLFPVTIFSKAEPRFHWSLGTIWLFDRWNYWWEMILNFLVRLEKVYWLREDSELVWCYTINKLRFATRPVDTSKMSSFAAIWLSLQLKSLK